MGIGREMETSSKRNPLTFQPFDLSQEHLGINHGTASDESLDMRIENPRGDEVEAELFPVDKD
jgi:hypothetical protein